MLLPKERRILGTLLLLVGSILLVLTIRDLLDGVDWTAVHTWRNLGWTLVTIFGGIRLRSVHLSQRRAVAYMILQWGGAVCLMVSLALNLAG